MSKCWCFPSSSQFHFDCDRIFIEYCSNFAMLRQNFRALRFSRGKCDWVKLCVFSDHWSFQPSLFLRVVRGKEIEKPSEWLQNHPCLIYSKNLCNKVILKSCFCLFVIAFVIWDVHVYIYADWILPQNTLEYNSWQFIMDYDHITVNSRMTVFHETDWISVACITSTASLDQISWKNLSTWSYRSQRMRWMKSSSTSKSSLTSERIWQLLAISVKSNDREYKYICQIEKEVNKVMDTMYIQYLYMYITCNVTFLDWQILQCFACYTVLLHLFWTANLLFIRE